MWEMLAVAFGLVGLAMVARALFGLFAARPPGADGVEPAADALRAPPASAGYLPSAPGPSEPADPGMTLSGVDAGHSAIWARYFAGPAAAAAGHGPDRRIVAWREALAHRLALLFDGQGPEDAPSPLTFEAVRPALAEALSRRIEGLDGFRTGYALLASLDDPSVRLSDLSRLIMSEPLLSGKVLKCVNSPYFGMRGQINSIPTAILILGMVNLRNVIYREHVVRLTDMDDPLLARFFDDLWEHLTITSVCCVHAAKAFDGVEPGALFTMGLLHDIGRFVIATSPLARQGDGVLPYDQGFSLEDENELFGINHALAGKLVAARWGFPPLMAAGLEHHHAPAFADRVSLGLDPGTLAHLCALFAADKLAGVFAPDGEEPPEPLHFSFHALVNRKRLEAAVLDPALARDVLKARGMIPRAGQNGD
jgi:HD-like signal output (HDOD) protein